MEIVKFSFTHLGIDWFLHVEPPVIKLFYHVFAAHVRHGRHGVKLAIIRLQMAGIFWSGSSKAD
jgi:hypothetical protein